MRRSLRFAVAALLLTTTARGVAAESPPPDEPAAPEEQPAPAPVEPAPAPTFFDTFVDTTMARTWREGQGRPFLATTIDIGYLYVRPRLTLGYGKPHYAWLGIDVNPIVSREMWGGYTGVRLSIPHFEWRAGGRYFSAFTHSYLKAASAFTRLELESNLGGAHALTMDSEANAQIPVGPGNILLLASVAYLTGVPSGSYLLEETLRLVVAPPWVIRGRAGYAVSFGSHDQISIGLVADVLSVPERKTYVVRAGAKLRFMMSRSFELRGTFVPRIHSPDDIGLLDSDFTELGLRWRWATE